VENVNATMNEDGDMMEHLADDCAWEAKTRGITKAEELTEAEAMRRYAEYKNGGTPSHP
jgi:hypothetical protein